MNKLEYLDRKIEEMGLQEISKDDKTESWKWRKPRKMRRLEKKSSKKPDYVLVEYLTQKQTVRRLLCKVVAGNVIVVDNKVHILNPKDTWRDGRNLWYKIREIDRLPISNRDYDRLIEQGRITVNDAVVIKAIVGAIAKKETAIQSKKILIWLLIIGIAAIAVYYLFFAK